MNQSVMMIDPAGSADERGDVLDRLLDPGRFYESPGDVVVDSALSLSEKRAILSSWASDACAVESCPPLRHPPFAVRPVSFDQVMDALAMLDRPAGAGLPEAGMPSRAGEGRPGQPA
jgi:hypothetical protein